MANIKFIIIPVIGKCTKCGECCGSVLPITQEDADRMQEYIYKNGIKPQKYMLVMQNRLSCPYYTGNREKGCAIYEARPNICRYFKCDKLCIAQEEYQKLKECVNVDMWKFALALEKEIDKEKRNGANKKARKTIK